MKNEINILIVETDEFQLELLSLILEEAGFIISSENSVSGAINFIRENNNTDLILSDLILPDASAIDMMIMMKELNISIPTILISSFRNSEIELYSGKNNEELLIELEKSGFKGIIERPSNSDDLVDEILKILYSHSVIGEEPDISAF